MQMEQDETETRETAGEYGALTPPKDPAVPVRPEDKK